VPLQRVTVALGLFASLVAINVFLAYDAVTNGPTWYRNYGLYGLQYGGRQLSAALRDQLEQAPATRAHVTSVWANGADTVLRFFLPDEPRITFGSLAAYQFERLPLGDNDLLVMTPDEYRAARAGPRFAGIKVTRVIPYPDGLPGFYFVRLRYSPEADTIFAAELRARRQPVVSRVTIDGQLVTVRYPRLDIGRIEDVFDGDPFTLARTLEANPAVLRLTFPRPRLLRTVSAQAGAVQLELLARAFPARGGEAIERRKTLALVKEDSTLTLDLGRRVLTKVLEIQFRKADVRGPDHVHMREVIFR
jgi:hypothetical protein